MGAERRRGRGVLVAGAGLALVGLLGYAAGVVAAYPGRAFSVTGFMVGITLVAVGIGHLRGEP